MRRLLTLLASLLVATSLGTAVSASAATSPYCGIRWGSLPKQHAITSTAPMTNVRAGRHTCFDRLVIDVAGPADGYRVNYVRTVAEDGSGNHFAVVGNPYNYEGETLELTPADLVV